MNTHISHWQPYYNECNKLIPHAFYILFFFLIESHKAEQPLRGIELQEKEEENDEKILVYKDLEVRFRPETLVTIEPVPQWAIIPAVQ